MTSLIWRINQISPSKKKVLSQHVFDLLKYMIYALVSRGDIKSFFDHHNVSTKNVKREMSQWIKAST